MSADSHPLDHLLAKCANIDTMKEYQDFVAELKRNAQHKPSITTRRSLENAEPRDRALGFLELATQERGPKSHLFREVFSTSRYDLPPDHSLLPAAAICFTLHRAEDRGLQEEILLGPGSFQKPPSSSDARHFLIKFMGFSQNQNFAGVLYKALVDHSHFCPPFSVAEALENLGYPINEEEELAEKQDKINFRRSITVTKDSENRIVIEDDKRFSGSSNCIRSSCPFFPCRINHYFPRAIEDCKLWKKINPANLGEIVDWRDWGHERRADIPIPTRPVNTGEATEGERLFQESSYCEAIPYLTREIIDSPHQASALGWVRLAICLENAGEDGLASLLLREALALGKTLPKSCELEVNRLRAFEASPRRPLLERKESFDAELRGHDNLRKIISYKEHGFYVRAFDYQVMDAVLENETAPSKWFGIGECHQGLGEPTLAELMFRQAASTTTELSLREKFERHAERAREPARSVADPGIAREDRQAERRAADLESLLNDPSLLEEPSPDSRREAAFWLAMTEEVSMDRLFEAVLDRFRWEESGSLIRMPREFTGRTFYLLNKFAETTLRHVKPGLQIREIKDLDLFQRAQMGLDHLGKYREGAALFAILHDQTYNSCLHSNDVLQTKAPYLALTRFQAAYRIYLSDMFNEHGKGMLRIVQGAIDLLEQASESGDCSREEVEDLRSEMSLWKEEVRDELATAT